MASSGVFDESDAGDSATRCEVLFEFIGIGLVFHVFHIDRAGINFICLFLSLARPLD